MAFVLGNDEQVLGTLAAFAKHRTDQAFRQPIGDTERRVQMIEEVPHRADLI